MGMSEETKRQYEREKQGYWQLRQELLLQYPGKWVAVVDGKVAGVADQMNRAAAEASRNVGRRIMYVNLVGNEDVVLRIRQLTMQKIIELPQRPRGKIERQVRHM